MRWQEVYRILPLLVGAYDVVRASIDCDDDTLVKLGDANDNDGLAHLQNDNTDRFDFLSEFPPIHFPPVAVLEPGAELASFEKSTLTKRVFNPKRGSGRGTGGGTLQGRWIVPGKGDPSTGPKIPEGPREEDPDSPGGGASPGRAESSAGPPSFETISPTDIRGDYSTGIASSSARPHSFKTISPTTICGADSTVIASSSAGPHTFRAISPTTICGADSTVIASSSAGPHTFRTISPTTIRGADSTVIASCSAGPHSFKTISPTTTRGADSTVIASSSVVASAHAVSTSVSTAIAAATGGCW